VALINLGPAPYTVTRGDRIAQLLLAPVPEVVLVEADELTASDRGDGGFGSTGTR
jgi:dUTP pyrophosphatase